MRNALEFDTLEKSFALQFGEAVELVEHPIPDGDGITYPTAEEKEVKTNTRYYSEIARVIQEKGKTNVPFLPCDMPAGVVGVYAEGEKVGYNAGHSSGYEEGKADGNAEGYAAGKQAEYDAFWDDFQHNGNRVNYNYAFFDGSGATQSWGDVSFKPKYPIKPLEATSTFQGLAVTGELTSKVEIDLSKAQSIMNCFAYAHSITRLGVIDCRAVTQNHITFCANCTSLNTIDEVILKNDGTQVHSLSSWNFSNCVNLRNIKITGVIPFNVNLQYSPLSKESFTSVINALSSTATGLTATFKKTAKEAAFTAEEWAELIATKTNWTFSLV